MFERRLKILLAVMFGLTALLLARAVQVQLAQGADWRQRAADAMRRSMTTETTRGRIVDRNGRELAVDEPCTDAAVDYRAIVRDEQWIKEVALARLGARPEVDYRRADKARKVRLLEEEMQAVRTHLDQMWETLARAGGKTLEEIEQLKESIRQRVEMRRRYVWYTKYRQAMERHENKEPEPWYRQWMLSGTKPPELDTFALTVEEETQAHVILRAIDDATYVELGRLRQRCPGLELVRGKHRLYPRGSVACHVIGRVGTVTRQVLDSDPSGHDERRLYLPNDLVGRSGIEALCEPVLRGWRGRIERQSGREQVLSAVDPAPGQDVRLTLDAELQSELEEAFARRREFRDAKGELIETRQDMHGAAVVLDVASSQVLALVSYPTFDLNRFEALYPVLVRDEVNKPLFARATHMAVEPGSTAKAIVAMGALSDGTVNLSSTVECTGYLVLNGVRYGWGRCWIARQYAHLGIDVKHHKHPANDPHPSGFLNAVDALQRSCNIYYETVADMMGLERVAYWFDRFGLGHPTGLGLPEAAGRIPRPGQLPRAALRMNACLTGIGQGPVSATPLQMANVAATLARDGIWMRPRILADHQSLRRAAATAPVDIQDLRLRAVDVDLVRQGMVKVVNTSAGTGNMLYRDDVVVAGKTGSAQAGKLRIPKLDSEGSPVYREVTGRDGQTLRRLEYEVVEPNAYPWYQGTGQNRDELAHAWFVGFAPADKPQIAFAVLVEYGGSGGRVAGAVAKDLLESCVQHGYLAGRRP
jgi:penicillin-binding protein 2